MVDVVRAELLKIARRPGTWVLLGAATVLNQVFGYLVPYLSYRSGDTGDMFEGAPAEAVLASTAPDQLVGTTIGAFPVFAGALALVFGALVLGGEHALGTVKTLLTQRPGRLSVVAGQVVAVVVSLGVAVLVLFALGSTTSYGIATAEGLPVDWPGAGALAQGFAVGLLVLSTWALLGGVLGVLLRGVALPIGLGVVWVLGIENLVSAMAGSLLSALQPLQDVLPGVNAGSLVSAAMAERLVEPPPGVVSTVAEPRALATLLAYAVGSAMVAAWVTRRRDVA